MRGLLALVLTIIPFVLTTYGAPSQLGKSGLCRRRTLSLTENVSGDGFWFGCHSVCGTHHLL